MTNLTDASILLVVTDALSDEIVEVAPCDGIDEALDIIAARCTHPDEDLAVARDAVGATWADHVELGGRTGEFIIRRRLGAPVGRAMMFALFAVERIGSTDLPDARRPAAKVTR